MIVFAFRDAHNIDIYKNHRFQVVYHLCETPIFWIDPTVKNSPEKGPSHTENNEGTMLFGGAMLAIAMECFFPSLWVVKRSIDKLFSEFCSVGMVAQKQMTMGWAHEFDRCFRDVVRAVFGLVGILKNRCGKRVCWTIWAKNYRSEPFSKLEAVLVHAPMV